MSTTFRSIDDKAVAAARVYRQNEAELLACIQDVNQDRVFERFGYPSLYAYCTQRLLLSDSIAYAFISVARKAVAVPELGHAVAEGKINVSQAKRIVSVVKPANVKKWVEKAATSKQRELEQAVSAELPAPEAGSRVRSVGGGMSEMKLVIPDVMRKEIERLQEVRGCTALEAIEYAVRETLKRRDPLRRAARATERKSSRKPSQPSSRKATRKPSAAVQHEVVLRDEGQCTFRYSDGKRCENRRWLHMHHDVPFGMGGASSAENLALVCAQHHRAHHREGPTDSR